MMFPSLSALLALPCVDAWISLVCYLEFHSRGCSSCPFRNPYLHYQLRATVPMVHLQLPLEFYVSPASTIQNYLTLQSLKCFLYTQLQQLQYFLLLLPLVYATIFVRSDATFLAGPLHALMGALSFAPRRPTFR